MNKSIYLIDDDPSVNEYNKLLIKKIHPEFQVLTFKNTINFVNFLKRIDKAIFFRKSIYIFLDIHFPNDFGINLIKEIEDLELAIYFNIKIYLLSTDKTASILEKPESDSIIQKFINKPLTTEIIEKLELST